jgi:hypothetical protein
MDIGPLTVESHPKQEDVQCLDDRLYEYNASQTGVDDGQWLAIFVRDAQQTMCAGIKGWTRTIPGITAIIICGNS